MDTILMKIFSYIYLYISNQEYEKKIWHIFQVYFSKDYYNKSILMITYV